METFAPVLDRYPMLSVFREGLRRTYEVPYGPLPSCLEELLQRLPELDEAAE